MALENQHTVILDTNVLYGDPNLRSGALNQLIRSCRVANVPVLLPELVVLELVAQYEPAIRNRLQDASRAIKDLGQYIYTGSPPDLDIDAQSLVKGYEKWLKNRLLDLGIEILEIPEIPQKSIMKRAIEKRRPFTGRETNQKGDPGYKDTLIWESILAFLTSNSCDVVLVTNDKGFGEDEKLHGDLARDLTNQGHPIDRVILKTSYNSAIEHLSQTYDFQTYLQEEEWSHVTKEELQSVIEFAYLLNQQKSSIESALASGPSFSEDVRLFWDVEPHEVDFEPEYIGNGEWKISGFAYWETELEWYDFDQPQIFAEKSETVSLEIKFTIYYDYKNQDTDHETIIQSVGTLEQLEPDFEEFQE